MRAFGSFSPAARAVVMVGATSLFMVMVAWATLIGPDQVFTGPGLIERTAQAPTRTCVPLETVATQADGTIETVRPDNPQNLPWCDEPAGTSGEPSPTRQGDPPLWLQVLTWTFILVILGGMVALMVFLALLVRDQMGRRSRAPERQQVEFAVLGEPERLREAIVDDAAGQEAVLRDGDPRNAIVAAWQRFEVQGQAAGAGRRPWETSSEYAIRILDVVSADSGAVHRLAVLYREARFSTHPITEQHRTGALEALADIRRSLGART